MDEPAIEEKNIEEKKDDGIKPSPAKTGASSREGASDPVFYYSRERRLSHASARVLALNEEGSSRRGFVRSLVGHKGNLFMLVAILIVCLVFVFTSRSSGGGKGLALGGNTLTLLVTADGGGAALSIIKGAPKSGDGYTGAVDLAISPVIPKGAEVDEYPILTHRIFFTYAEEEDYLVPLPFDGDEFILIFQSESERASARIKKSGKR
jgi:hypothetical protein